MAPEGIVHEVDELTQQLARNALRRAGYPVPPRPARPRQTPSRELAREVSPCPLWLCVSNGVRVNRAR